jgi:FimV-like protein
MAKGQAQLAVLHYREALRVNPQLGRARLGLASALISVGDVSGAVSELQKAAADSNPRVREEAAQILRKIGKTP